MKNFIKLDDLVREEIYSLLNRANVLQERWKSNSMPKTLRDKRIALWFYGQGFRNSVAFELGARSLGADVTFIPGELGVHEPIEDITHYLNNWFSMIVIRCRNYNDLEKVVKDSELPIINARTAFNHPCEILGDLQYVYKTRGTIDNLKIAFFGEVTNLCMSWFEAAKVLPIEVIQIAPEEYLASEILLNELNKESVGKIATSTRIDSCVTGETDIIYTDCWPKQEDNERVKELFIPYQVNSSIIKKMSPRGFFMPCPPIRRGEEISEDSLAMPQYCDYQAKEYLLHSQNAIMEYCINEKFA